MTVIAQRGDHTFMLLVEGRRDRIHQATVRVFDQRYQTVGEPMNGISVLARGYWDEVASDVDVAAVVSEAKGLLAAAAA